MPPLYHLVLLTYKPSVSEEKVKELAGIFLDLKTNAVHAETKKPYIAEITGGKGNSYDGLDFGYTHGFTVVFNSVEDRNYYISHDPVHAKFADDMKEFVEKIVAVDYVPGEF